MGANNINIDNPYLYSIVKAMQEFLIEELKGYSFTELRLAKKIESARELFLQEKKELTEQYKRECRNSASQGTL